MLKAGFYTAAGADFSVWSSDAVLTQASPIRHGGAGRSLVEKRFSLDLMVRRYDELYADALRGSLPAATAITQLR